MPGQNEKLKVLFLASWYPNKFRPTDGNFIERHAEAVSLYDEVGVLFVHSDPALKNGDLEFKYKENNGVKILKVYYGVTPAAVPFLKDLIKGFYYFRAIYKGFQFIERKVHKFDIVHVNVIMKMGILALILKYAKGLPYVITEHWTGYGNDHYKGFFNKFFTRLIANNASRLLPVSLDLKKAMLKHKLNNRYDIVPNVVNIELFKSGDTGKSTEKIKLLHISTLLDEHKNVTGILEVIKEISLLRDDLELHIVGDIEENRVSVEERSAELNLLNKTVFVHGLRTMEEIAQMMKEAQFFILFSNYENLPCVLIESMAAGLPVITTNVGGIAEHVNSERGVLIEQKDQQALKKAVLYMLDHYAGFDPEKISQYASEHFSYQSVGSKFHEIYLEVIR